MRKVLFICAAVCLITALGGCVKETEAGAEASSEATGNTTAGTTTTAEVATTSGAEGSWAAMKNKDNWDISSRSNIIGYWRAAAEFDADNLEAYHFHKDGTFDYYDTDGNKRSGVHGPALMTTNCQFYDNPMYPNFAPDFSIARDFDMAEETGTRVMIVEGKRFYKCNKPRDVINGVPLYIEFAEDFVWENSMEGYAEFAYKLTDAPDVIISFKSVDGFIMDISVDRAGVDMDGIYWYNGEMFSFYPNYPGTVLRYATHVREWVSQAVTLLDYRGTEHTYILKVDKNNKLDLIKTVLRRKMDAGDTIKKKLGTEGSVEIRFFKYTDPMANFFTLDYYKYTAVQIPLKNFAKDFARLMLEHTGMKIKDVWYDDGTIFVDLHKHSRMWVDNGSTGSTINGTILILTMSSFPGAEEIVVFLNGERFGGDHFDYSQPFKAIKVK